MAETIAAPSSWSNPEIINAFKSESIHLATGKPFPDGSRMAKIHWNAKISQGVPGAPLMPVSQHDVDFMVKDSQRGSRTATGGVTASSSLTLLPTRFGSATRATSRPRSTMPSAASNATTPPKIETTSSHYMPK